MSSPNIDTGRVILGLTWRAGLPHVSIAFGLRGVSGDSSKSYSRKCSTTLLNVGFIHEGYKFFKDLLYGMCYILLKLTYEWKN